MSIIDGVARINLLLFSYEPLGGIYSYAIHLTYYGLGLH